MPTIWALPNFSGELFTADSTNTPFLTMMGGLNGGGLLTQNFDFPTASQYDLPAAAQPDLTENDSIVAPAANNIVRRQVLNTTQIFHEAIQLTYVKQTNSGRMNGVNTAGQVNNAVDELAFQQARKLEKIARDAEFSFIQGAYQQAVDADTAARTRGIAAACALAGGTNVDNAGAGLDLSAMQNLFLQMYNNGAPFSNVVLYVNGLLKQQISSIYGFAPTDRNVGGVNIQQLETDFGNIGIVVSRFAPANEILAIDMSVCNVVFQEVPGKGILFYEELGKTGAAESGQMFGQMGLDHGPAFAHGRLFNIV